MDTTAATQQPCTLCTKRLQGHRAFGLFTAQLQRIRSAGDAASGSSVRDSSRTGKRSLAALQRAQLYPAAKSRSKYLDLQPETPKRVRDDPAWQLRATADSSQAGQTAAADQVQPVCCQSANRNVCRHRSRFVSEHLSCLRARHVQPLRRVGVQPPPGCSRYTVELRKPLGLVLEEDRHGSIFVVRLLFIERTNAPAQCSRS